MKNLQYDGIDIDLEGENIDGNYEGFIDDLSKALKSEKKLLTAAISTSEAQKLTNKALAHFDFLSIMSYDNVPYQEFFLPLPLEMKKIRLFHPSQHSSMNLAIHDLNFWTNARHISREKLNLGIPFYGYYFANGRISKLSYRTIMLQHPGMQDSDTIRDQKGILIYNGIPTIRQKTELAKSYVGGIMLWELMEDTTDETSLLKAANQVLNLTEK
jgi:GH18 family chitinase